MTYDLSRRSLLALGAGLGASTVLGSNAFARAPKLGTQPAYFYRFGLGDAEVTVVSDGPLPLGRPRLQRHLPGPRVDPNALLDGRLLAALVPFRVLLGPEGA